MLELSVLSSLSFLPLSEGGYTESGVKLENVKKGLPQRERGISETAELL